MKHFSFSLTESDIKALICGLEILPTLDLGIDDIQQSINNALCASCIEKLLNQSTDYNSNELRVMYCALAIMDEIIRDEWEIDVKLMSECRNFIFNVNKLLPLFESALPADSLLDS